MATLQRSVAIVQPAHHHPLGTEAAADVMSRRGGALVGGGLLTKEPFLYHYRIRVTPQLS
jgi:hypothetical protein